jgi:hypothetical protein
MNGLLLVMNMAERNLDTSNEREGTLASMR